MHAGSEGDTCFAVPSCGPIITARWPPLYCAVVCRCRCCCPLLLLPCRGIPDAHCAAAAHPPHHAPAEGLHQVGTGVCVRRWGLLWGCVASFTATRHTLLLCSGLCMQPLPCMVAVARCCAGRARNCSLAADPLCPPACLPAACVHARRFQNLVVVVETAKASVDVLSMLLLLLLVFLVVFAVIFFYVETAVFDSIPQVQCSASGRPGRRAGAKQTRQGKAAPHGCGCLTKGLAGSVWVLRCGRASIIMKRRCPKPKPAAVGVDRAAPVGGCDGPPCASPAWRPSLLPPSPPPFCRPCTTP